MLDCEGDVRVGRSGCQRHGKELQLFVLLTKPGQRSGSGGRETAQDYLHRTPHLQSALNPDYRMHLLSLPLLKSNVIRKSAFLDLCGHVDGM